MGLADSASMASERRPRMLIIGLDRHGMQACARLGVDAVVVCGAAAWDQGLIAIPDPLTALRVDEHNSPEAVLMGLHRAGLAGKAFDAVYTTDEWSLVMAGMLARHLGLPGLDPDVAVRFRDKSLQKSAVRAAGLPTAASMVIEDIHDVSGIEEMRFRRAVLKPVAGAATARTSVVESVADLRARSREHRLQQTSQRTFVLEEYVDGEEWFADGIVSSGELLFCAVGRYGDPCLATLDRGQPLWLRHFDPSAEDWAYRRAVPVVAAALAALGLRDAPFHMELFHDPQTGRLTFSECAARRGGGLIHEQILLKFQVDLAECALLAALGRRPEVRPKTRPEVVGSMFLNGSPGTLLGCPSAAELAAQPGVAFARIERPVGSHFPPDLASTNQRVGQVLVMADSIGQLEQRLAAAQEWFATRLRILPDGLNGRELRERQREPPAQARGGDAL